MESEIKTVEVPATETQTEESRPTMTVSEAKSNGWGEKEIESGLKRKMLVEEQTAEEKAKNDEEQKAKADSDSAAKVKADGQKNEEKVKRSSIPDFTMTPEQEKVFLDTFGPGTPPRAMYFRMKNERQARQASEARIRELEAHIEASKKAAEVKQPILDEEGNEVDPEEKPLTIKQLKELQEKERKEYEKKQQEQTERAQRVTEAQTFQEEYARSVFPDFDDTVTKAKEVMQNLDAMVPEKWKQARIISLIRELQEKAANADKIGVDEDNAAFIAYEIGRFHPEHGKKADRTNDGKPNLVDPKANGGLTPEQMERAIKNNQRKPMSASIAAGNGRRTITADEVSIEDLNRMNYKDRAKFKADHPERYAKLVRG